MPVFASLGVLFTVLIVLYLYVDRKHKADIEEADALMAKARRIYASIAPNFAAALEGRACTGLRDQACDLIRHQPFF